ncbi:MAG: hypothetical protein IJQ31_13850 [Thermoguttaceae bacterium]|nr:hypothetical protein [Thermoguttaceae bacterium]
MKTKTMLSIEEDLKNAADEYVKTHKDARSFSGLVSQALKEYIHREEKMKDEADQNNVKMILLKNSLTAWRNLCEDMMETFEISKIMPSNPQKVERWMNTMEQQQEIITLFISPANKSKDTTTPKDSGEPGN